MNAYYYYYVNYRYAVYSNGSVLLSDKPNTIYYIYIYTLRWWFVKNTKLILTHAICLMYYNIWWRCSLWPFGNNFIVLFSRITMETLTRWQGLNCAIIIVTNSIYIVIIVKLVLKTNIFVSFRFNVNTVYVHTIHECVLC